ncbi:hypothetical protein R1flu_018160 [Riccia fluitans]|uniref:Uncharacterized protein n=1 Tax=Riccia fluitans TaxID=41844 RepID=A0ABD1ZG28_9MARC
MDYHSLPRKDLQLLCKKHGIPANKTNLFMAEALTRKRIPLSEVSVNREAEIDVFSVTPLKLAAAKVNGDVGNQSLFTNTPFLMKRSQKNRATPNSSDAVIKDQVEASVATSRVGGTRLFPEEGCSSVSDTSKDAGTPGQRKTTIENDLPGPLREQRKPGRPAKRISVTVKQKPEEKRPALPKSTAGPHHQLEIRLTGKSGVPVNGTNTAHDVTPIPTPVASSGAPQQAERGAAVTGEITAVNAEFVVDTESVLEHEENGCRSPGSSRCRRPDDSALNDERPVQVELASLGSQIETNQLEENGQGEPPPKERFIVKVTFADEVSIKHHKSGAVEKMKLEEHIARRLEITSATGDGNAVEPNWDPKPAPPFVFQASRQEETKPTRGRKAAKENPDLRRKAAKGNSDLRSSVTEIKAPIAGLKHEEAKARNTELKVKPEPKLNCGVPVSSFYSKPSKRARVGASGSKTLDDTKGVVDKVPFSPAEAKLEVRADTFELPAASSHELKILELPEWAKEFKRKQEETIVESSTVADTPNESAKVETAASGDFNMTPLKKIEDKVGELLDRLKAFWRKTDVEAVRPAAEATNEDIGCKELSRRVAVVDMGLRLSTPWERSEF